MFPKTHVVFDSHNVKASNLGKRSIFVGHGSLGYVSNDRYKGVGC